MVYGEFSISLCMLNDLKFYTSFHPPITWHELSLEREYTKSKDRAFLEKSGSQEISPRIKEPGSPFTVLTRSAACACALYQTNPVRILALCSF